MKKLFGRFSKKSNNEKTAPVEQPQQQDTAASFSSRERERIARLRQQELERQRKREQCRQDALPSKICSADESGLANESGIEVMKDSVKQQQKANSKSKRLITSSRPCTLSLSKACATCVVCQLQKPTHVATPCLHYSFCAKCASNLTRNALACPVCGTPHTTYNQVFA